MFSCKVAVRKRLAHGLIAVILSCCLLGGCQTPKQKPATPTPTRYDCNALSSKIEYADVRQCSLSETPYSLPPRTLDDAAPAEFWDMSYEEALSIALANSSALKDLGVRVLRSPEGVATVFDPAIRQSDPIFGPEGALSEFDARVSTGLFWEKSDRAVNNAILQGNVPGGVPFELARRRGHVPIRTEQGGSHRNTVFAPQSHHL